jgi:CRP/FNR family cyclic AMP-dependent transcriptional regulator
VPKGLYTGNPDLRDRGTDPRVWSNVLETVPLFSTLSRRHLKKVAGAGRLVRFHDRTAIIRANEAGDTLYVVLEGDVVVRRRGLPELKLGMGSFFGEMALLDGGTRSATVITDGEVLCLAISRQRFTKVLRSEPSIAIGMLAELATRLRAAQAVG